MHAVNSSGWFGELLAERQGPCVSIYFPAERAKPMAAMNLKRFRNLVDKVEREMRDKYPDKRGKAVLRQLAEVPQEQLGPGPHDGIAVFAAADYLQVLDLQSSVDDLCVVSDSFHVKPLIRTMQYGDHFEILCFSPNRIRILDANQYNVAELPLRDVPAGIHDARLIPVQGTQPQEATMPTDRFMRLVDQAVWENHSRTSHLPMIVTADARQLAEFLSITRNAWVLDEGIALNPDHLSNERLRDEAWKIMEPRHQAQLRRLIDQYRMAKAHSRGTDELPQVAEAAANGRVGTLIVDANRHVPGVLHRASGMIEQATQFDPRAEDLLDDLAEMVLKMDGQVYVLPHEHMPTEAGVAAVLRY